MRRKGKPFLFYELLLFSVDGVVVLFQINVVQCEYVVEHQASVL